MKSSTNHSKPANVFNHIKYEHLVAGVTGGVASTLLLHPLDLLKIRFAGKTLFLCFLFTNTFFASKWKTSSGQRNFLPWLSCTP